MKTFFSIIGLVFIGLVLLTLLSPKATTQPSELCGRGKDMIAATGGRVSREEVERTGVCDNAVAQRNIDALEREQNGR